MRYLNLGQRRWVGHKLDIILENIIEIRRYGSTRCETGRHLFSAMVNDLSVSSELNYIFTFM
jgi:hypothetical protein